MPRGSTLALIGLALRSLLWMALLPGFVAGYVPYRYFGLATVPPNRTRPDHMAGLLLMALGIGLLTACIFEFARSGRGTLSPVDPPRELVIRGLYRYVRNPMYLAVLTIVAGEVLLTRSVGLAIYWLVFFLAANMFVMTYEEPTLRAQFGDSYEAYTAHVGRWLPSLKQAKRSRSD
jgi:protein-S-isoprenylcysteine O-methyltransferase Ste14